jgi:hypothetical protein
MNMFESILTIIDFVLGKSLDTVGKLRGLAPSKKRQAAQSLLSLKEDLEKLKMNATFVAQEVGYIIEFHRRNEYDSRTIEHYVEAINDAHIETMKILRHILLPYQTNWLRVARGVHVHNVLTFLQIKDPTLARDVSELLGGKFMNLLVLLHCSDLIYKKQVDKSLRSLRYITNIDIDKLKHALSISVHRDDPNAIEDAGVISTKILDTSKVDQLILYRQGVNQFVNNVDTVIEKVRQFIANNFTIEEIL